MKRWMRRAKRGLAFMLAAAMIFTLMPQTELQVSAAEYRTETEISADTHVIAEQSETNWGLKSETGETSDEKPEISEETSPDNEDGTDEEAGSAEEIETGEEAESAEKIETGEETGSEEGTGTGEEADPGEGDDTSADTDSDEGDVSDEETDSDAEDGTGEEETETETETEEEENPLEISISGEEEFVIDAEGTLTKYNGAGGNVSIPDSVRTVGADAFRENANITGVTIPGSVIKIESGAFQGCTRLEKVIFESGNEELVFGTSWGSGNTFMDCKSLKEVTLPGRLKILKSNAFQNCAALESVTFEEGLEDIEGNAFRDCIKLKGADLPSTLKTIGGSAFEGCTSLSEVSMKDGLTTIGGSAFAGADFGGRPVNGNVPCGTVTIPGSVTEIGSGAFRGCTHLGKVVFESGSEELVAGISWGSGNTFMDCKSLKEVILSGRLKELPSNAFQNCTALETVTFEEGLEVIGGNVFQGCTSLKGADLPSTLKTIGAAAFAGTDLGGQSVNGVMLENTVTIPGSVTNIGAGAFEGCTRLGKVVFENGSEELVMGISWGNGNTFMDCKSLKEVILPGRLKELPGNAFQNCAALETVTFGEGMEGIGGNAFKGCTRLKGADLPSTLKTIGGTAFEGCTSLSEVSMKDGLTAIGAGAFSGADFGGQPVNGNVPCGTVTIPGSVTEIGSGAFQGCTHLGKVVFESGNEELVMGTSFGNGNTFMDCKSLKEVILPGRLKTLESNAFQNCIALETVTFGEGMEGIGGNAFKGCIKLKGADLPSTLKTIGGTAFEGCISLSEVSMKDGLTAIGAGAFSGADFGGQPVNGNVPCGTVTIPGSVTEIGSGAFQGCTHLGKVVFESGNEELVMKTSYGNGNTFMDCKSLKEVILPGRLKTLEGNAFQNCTALETVTFGEGMEDIGGGAFKGCTSLKRADLPSTLKTIGGSAFEGCTSLSEVSLKNGLTTIGGSAFKGAALGGQPVNGVMPENTVTIPGSVTNIGAGAFQGCTRLGKVVFESGNEELVLGISWGSASTFMDCKSLKEVILPKRLKELPGRVFQNCTNLEFVYIPESVITISSTVLTDCKKAVIYGERGSEAENYAKANGIPFRDASDALKVKDISLDRSNITTTEDKIGSTVVLRATVKPGTALNKMVVFSSDNPSVATVDEKGTVTLQGCGKAVITATAEEDNSIKATCTVEVLRQWSEDEKEAIKNSLQTLNASKLTVITNVCPKVKDIELDLPAEYALESADWRHKEYEIADGARPVYDVIVKKDGYQDAVIRGLAITGITVEEISVTGAGAGKLQNGTSTDLTVKIVTAGGELPEGSYDPVEWVTSGSAVALGEKNGDTATVKGVSKGTATVTAKLTVKNGNKKVTLSSPAFKITVTNDKLASSVDITITENGKTVSIEEKEEELKKLADLEEVKEYQLSAAVRDGNDVVIENPSLQWKSSNTKVAEIKGSGSEATLKVKAETGSAVISVTANKNGGVTRTFRITVKDSMPRLEETGISLNLNQTEPSAAVHIVPSDGYLVEVESAILMEKGGNSDFTIKKISDTEYRITGLKSLNTGKYKVCVQAKANGKDYSLPITISVVKQIPKVTIAQEGVINLYETDAEAKITFSAEAEIEKITYTPSVDGSSNKPTLVVKANDPEAGYLTLVPKNLNQSNYKSTSLKGNIEITFKGYDASVVYRKNSFAVKANKNLPAILAVPASTVLYTGSEYEGTGLDTTTVSFRIKTDSSEITEASGWHMAPQKAINGVDVTESSEEQPLTVTFRDEAKKSVALKFNVTKNNWIDGVTATASCTIKKGGAPELGFSNNKVILNARDAIGADPLKIDLFVKNQSGREIVGITSIVGKNGAADDALKDKLDILFENGRLEISIRKGASFNKNMKFSYRITGVCRGIDGRDVPASGNLDVTVSTQAMKLTLKQSGSIDLLNREGTQITLKPTLKNYTDTVRSVALYGGYAGRFSADRDENGNIIIQAKEGSLLKVKTAYNLSLGIELESGVVQYCTVKVTPKQTNPKLTVNMSKITLFESASGETYGKEIAVNVAKAGGPEIESIELTNGGDTFGYGYDQDGKGTLYVLGTASQKVNKTYKLKLAVRFKDGGSNAAPVYVTVSVNYRK